MRILVCGGRDFTNKDLLKSVLSEYLDCIDVLVHGAAKGADILAAQWADSRGIPTESYPADWNKHGRSAGPIRNRLMLNKGKPDLVVAFPTRLISTVGSGTGDMITVALEAGIPVYIFPSNYKP